MNIEITENAKDYLEKKNRNTIKREKRKNYVYTVM